MNAGIPVLAQGSRRAWFVALVAYYAFALYLVPSSASVERFSLTYFALVIPVWVYVAGNWRFLFSGYSLESALMAFFAVLACITGIVREDLPLSYNAVFLAVVAIVILNSKVHLTITELNWIFLGCVAGSVAIFVLGITAYGFLPGQSETLHTCHAFMNWRISLFRVTAESAMFSLVVLIANIAYGDRLRGWIRGLAIFVSTYFLIFSGIRSIVFAALIVIPVLALIAMRRLSTEGRRRAMIGIFAGAVAILSVPHWLGTTDGFWANYAFRTKTCSYDYWHAESSGVWPEILGLNPNQNQNQNQNRDEFADPIMPQTEWYSWTLNRHCAGRFQLKLFTASPLGSSDIQPKSDRDLTDLGCPKGQLNYYCASCSFGTYWLARSGVAAIPMLLSFFVLLAGAIKRRSIALALALIAFAIVSLGWGVMYVPYNVIFLLMVAMPSIAAAHELRSKEL
jgi:hypothetical protein